MLRLRLALLLLAALRCDGFALRAGRLEAVWQPQLAPLIRAAPIHRCLPTVAQVAAGSGEREPSGRLASARRALRKLTSRPRNSLPPWLRKVLAVLLRAKPLLPALLCVLLVLGSATRRAAAAPRPVEVPFRRS